MQGLVKILMGKMAYIGISSLIVIVIFLSTEQRFSTLNDDRSSFSDCRVLHVIDGDSIKVNCQGRALNLRLQHIDAPEISQSPWGRRAEHALTKLLEQHVDVSLHGKDIYGRYLAALTQQGLDINLALVQQGYARVYSRYQPPESYKKAMQAAKSQGLGIWQKAGLQQNPQRWRRLSQ